MKISSLKRGDLIEFDCYEAHYWAKFIKTGRLVNGRETKTEGLIASFQSQDKSDWHSKGYFKTPTNIKRSAVKPPKSFKLPR